MKHVLIHGGDVLSEEAADVAVPWWSFTKTVIAAAALALVRDGKLTLDEKIAGRAFTLRQLLRHEAGLPDYGALEAYQQAVARGEAAWPVEKLLENCDAERLRYRPGQGWAYSNVGYHLAGRLIEETAGVSLGNAIDRLILNPLGVDGVCLLRTRDDVPRDVAGLAPGYDPGWVYHGLLAGSCRSAALTLARLVSGPLLPPELKAAAQDARVLGARIPGRPWLEPGYGLGLMVGKFENGLNVRGHTGGGPESVIAVFHAPDSGRTAVAFAEGSDAGVVERAAAGMLEPNAVADGIDSQPRL